MGEIFVRGKSARDFVQKLTSNDVDTLEPGKVQYSCFPNGRGGIVDDLLVYCMNNNEYLLVVNAANIEKDWNWLNSNNSEGAELDNQSASYSQLALQGPNAKTILSKICDRDLDSMKNFRFEYGKVGSNSEVLISNTGYTGAGGYELYFRSEKGTDIWDDIMEAGKEEGLIPAGLAARDTLRLEMGFCLYGNDINEDTSPIEAGLGWITKISDNNNFIDKEFLAEQKEEGVSRNLTGIELLERGIPRKDYTILSLHGEEIGTVTSGTLSPLLEKGIGMGYIKKPFSTAGTELLVQIRNKRIRAKVVKPPFIKDK
jgi:aminomethyltransferase